MQQLAESALLTCDSEPQFEPAVHGLPEPRGATPNEGPVFFHPKEECTVFFFHGRGRGVEHNYWFLGQVYRELKATIKVFEYPTCRTPASSEDVVDAAAQFLKHNVWFHRQRNVVLCASFGCSIVLQALQRVPEQTREWIDGIVFENPHTSIAGVIEHHIPALPLFLLSVLALDKWSVTRESVRGLPGGKRAMVVVSALDDMVPPQMGLDLAEWLGTENVTVLPKCNHGDAPAHPAYLPALAKFVASLKK